MTQDSCTGVLLLVRSAICREKLALPEGFSLEEVLPFLKTHEIEGLALEGAMLCGVSIDTPGVKALRSNAAKCLLVTQRQEAALRLLMQTFEKNGIDYLPVKGTILRQHYPMPELRTMGDADILIRREQYDKVAPLMEQLGYSFAMEDLSVKSWTSPRLLVELHVDLVPETDGDLYRYYKNPWRLGRQIDNTHRYEMSHEDAFVFLFAHFAKHCRRGGVGIRQMTDLWVHLTTFADMDMAYIDRTMEQLGLLPFYKNVMDTLRIWFVGGEHTEATKVITMHILNSGVFGTQESSELVRALRVTDPEDGKKSKWKLLLNAVFPPYTRMREVFPILREHRWLLPFCHIWRFIRALFLFPVKAIRKVFKSSDVSTDAMSEKKKMLDTMGIGTKWLSEK